MFRLKLLLKSFPLLPSLLALFAVILSLRFGDFVRCVTGLCAYVSVISASSFLSTPYSLVVIGSLFLIVMCSHRSSLMLSAVIYEQKIHRPD